MPLVLTESSSSSSIMLPVSPHPYKSWYQASYNHNGAFNSKQASIHFWQKSSQISGIGMTFTWGGGATILLRVIDIMGICFCDSFKQRSNSFHTHFYPQAFEPGPHFLGQRAQGAPPQASFLLSLFQSWDNGCYGIGYTVLLISLIQGFWMLKLVQHSKIGMAT